MTAVLLSLVESQGLTVLRSFLTGILPSTVEVIKGEINRVPEPSSPDFAIYWPLSQDRLGTNYTTYEDVVFSGSIASGILTVSSITNGTLTPGLVLLDTTNLLQPNSVLGTQISGTAGSVGTYNIAPSQTVSSETIYEGIRSDLAAVDWCVQVDVHGPNSGDNSRIIESLFRSDFATMQFATSGYDVTPLYADPPRQTPFINLENQYEYRWSIELHMQINPIVNTPQQFADQLNITLIGVKETYP